MCSPVSEMPVNPRNKKNLVLDEEKKELLRHIDNLSESTPPYISKGVFCQVNLSQRVLTNHPNSKTDRKIIKEKCIHL